MRPATLILAACVVCSPVFAGEAPFDGGKVHYETYGSGREAVVFIHGWTCDLTFWRAQAPIYEKYRSILVDLPGHGASDKPAADYTMERFARGVEAVLADAHVERAVLVGHSMGGPVALEFLRLFPQKTRAIVFVDSILRFDAPGEDRNLATLKAPGYKTWVSGLIDSMFSAHTTPALRAEIKAKMLATPQPVLVSAWEGMRSVAPLAQGEKYSIPALAILAGGVQRPAYEKRLRGVFPDLRAEIWNGSGHFLMMESPQRFNQSLAAFLDGVLAPQNRPAFEVASIKPSRAETRADGITTSHGQMMAKNVTLKRCIIGAWGIGPHQIVGGPDWLDADRFDIAAKSQMADGDDDAVMLMLQSLLADRFKLALHRETRSMQAFVLEVAKNGPRLEKTEPGESVTGSQSGPAGIDFHAAKTSMRDFARQLARVLDLPVVDHTQLDGVFNFKLQWTPDNWKSPAGETPGPSIFSALQEQLGLRLRAEKAPVEVLVIDHAEKPSEN